MDGSVRCPGRHSFDVARQGYVSLLPGDTPGGVGDTAAMVGARQRFLAAGHFAPIAAAVASAARGATGAVADLGAGSGYYLARVLDAAPAYGIALDVSKYALRVAARAHPRIGAVACDVWRRIPVRDGVVSVALNVFAPRNGAQTHRILEPGGTLVVVTPTERHLAELVAAFGLLTVDERKEERLATELSPHFTPSAREDVEYAMSLRPEDVDAVIGMGPSARHGDTRLDSDVQTTVTASVTVRTYTRR